MGEGNPGATRWTLAGLLVALNCTTKLPRSPPAIRAYQRMWQLVILTLSRRIHSGGGGNARRTRDARRDGKSVEMLRAGEQVDQLVPSKQGRGTMSLYQIAGQR